MPSLRTRTIRLASSLPQGETRTALLHLLASKWDGSVLGLTPEDIAEMEPEEKQDALRDRLNQAGDLAEALTSAFGPELGSQKSAVQQAAKALQQAARKI